MMTARMMDPPNDDGTCLPDGALIEPEPTWTPPLAARGDFETPTGYAKGWEYLREWPQPREGESS